jgi:hypothetical protein
MHGYQYLIPACILAWTVAIVTMFQWPPCERMYWTTEQRLNCALTSWHGPIYRDGELIW